MREWFRSNDGNRYRGFPTSGSFANGRTALTWLGSTVSSYLSAYQAKQGDGTDLMQMINVLNNTPSGQIQSLLPAEFSVDSFYRYASVMNIVTQTDSYLGSGKDHFLYHDPVHGDFHMFPFDVNESLAESTSLSPWYNTTLSTRPAFTKTFVVPEWRERYRAHYRSIVEETFNWGVLGPMVTQFHARLAPDVAADTKKIYTTQQFIDNLNTTVVIGGRSLVGLRPMIQNRETFLRNHADLNQPRTALTNLAHTPTAPNPTQSVTVTVAASSHANNVRLWWRRIGPFASTPMFDDGMNGDGAANDGVFGAILPAQTPGSIVDYFVEARTAAGLATFLPSTAEHRSAQFFVQWPRGTSPVRINEFVAQNVTGIVDENNQHEDWIELYNDSNVAVNIGGMWLSDDLARPKFRIPANFAIPAFGTVLVWADEDGTQGPLHANFKLAADGESIGLWASDGVTMLDDVTFGPQVADVAGGRLDDGGGPWVTFRSPTPRVRNEIAGCGTRSYGAQDSRAHLTSLALTGSPRIGTSPTLAVTGGPASGVVALQFALGAAHFDLSLFALHGEVLLLDPVSLFAQVQLPLDTQGSVSAPLSLPPDPNLVGLKVYLQGLAANLVGVDTTNAIEFVICP